MDNMVPRIVEIVGPAGAGKTTLYQTLSHCNGSIHAGNFPAVRKISAAPFFLWNGFQLFINLIGSSQHGAGKLTRREWAWLSILYGWPVVLRRELQNNKTIILDQGPVYLLTEVLEFGPEYLREKIMGKLMQTFYSQWADTLGMIVWLDADDADLLKRIRNRDKEHVVKNESEETALRFLDRYRKAYEQIIFNLEINHMGLKILRFDTSRNTPQEIADQLLFQFNLITPK
jgi:shikimate kinase